jgi:hypothetical protein
MRVRLVIEILRHLDVGLRVLLLDDELRSGTPARLADRTVQQPLPIKQDIVDVRRALRSSRARAARPLQRLGGGHGFSAAQSASGPTWSGQ